MKPGKILFISLLSCGVVSSSSFAAETTIEKVTLKPGEVKNYSLEATEKVKVGFKPILSSGQSCENNCIEISQVGGTSMASKFGGAIGMKPTDGKIELSLENVEKFPIEVELFRK